MTPTVAHRVLTLLVASFALGCGGSAAPQTTPSPLFPATHEAQSPTPTPTAITTTPERPTQASLDARPFDVFVPSGYDKARPMPLVIVLHWLGATGDEVEAEYKVEAVAEERGLLYVHPNGTKNEWGALSWNATDACCNNTATPADDSTYLAAVIERIKSSYNVDPNMVYVFGISNGGFMAYRMACDHADQIAAIVSVVGATFRDTRMCNPTKPVSVLEVHGTADETVPYDGGQFDAGDRFPGAQETVADWAGYNRCTGERHATGERLDLEADLPGAETIVSRFDACPAGIGAELWTVEGGTHALRISSSFVPEVVEFLLRHPRSSGWS